MPKSKRSKVVHLSKTGKKGKELTHKLYADVQTSADRYQYCFVFSVDNMRNTYLKDVRAQLPDSRLFFGKTKVMAKALGTTPESSHLPNLSNLTPFLTGNVGLLFTSSPPDTITSFFDTYTQTDFARAGTTATRDFVVPAGVIYSRGGDIPSADDMPMAHSLEPVLRKWGMPTRLVKGKVMLDEEHTVCKEDAPLDSHQTALLKMFGVAMAEFRVKLLAFYNSADEEVKALEVV